MTPLTACRREVTRARRAVTVWRRAIRDDACSLTPLQLAVCEARLATLQRDRRAAEDELERLREG